MKRMNRFMMLGLALGLVFLAAPAVQAAVVTAVTFTGNTSSTPVGVTETVGWKFTTTGISINGLGVFDSDLNGLATSHNVGIWNSSGILLASGTVASGTAGTLVNQFRYVSISPLLLGAGTYTIGATWFPGAGTDTYIAGSSLTSFQTAPGITFLGGEFIQAATLTLPTSSSSFIDPSMFGPNVTIPEPGTLILLGSGLLGLALAGSRKKFRK
jgi:hypothetical protein